MADPTVSISVPFKQWGIFAVLTATVFMLLGFALDRARAPNEVFVAGQPAPEIPTVTVFRPTFDPVGDDILFQNTNWGDGKLWVFTETPDSELTHELTWAPPSLPNPGKSVAAQLVQDYVDVGDPDAALAIAVKAPPNIQTDLLRNIIHFTRRQRVPMAEGLRPSLVDEPVEPKDRLARHNQLKSNFIAEKRNELQKISFAALKLPNSEAKAEVLADLKRAFHAVDQPQAVEEHLTALSACLEATYQNAESSTTRSALGFLLWPFIAVIGTAALAVWQQIATFYARKTVASFVNDRELLEALGENLRETGIILPHEFSKSEHELFEASFDESVRRSPK